MRCTQIFGLSEEAQEFLRENQYISSKEYKDARDEGMFDDGPILLEYVLKSGEVFQEFIQDIVWSSGPCIFLALRDVKNQKDVFLWSDEEMNNA